MLKGGNFFFSYAHCGAHVFAELRAQNKHAVLIEVIFQLAEKIVPAAEQKIRALRHNFDFCRLNRNFCSFGISAHKTANPKKRSAEIPRDHTANVGKLRAVYHVEHRHAAGSLRLAVVAGTAYLPLPQGIGINVVGGVAVFCPHFVNKGNGFVLALYRSNMSDKS